MVAIIFSTITLFVFLFGWDPYEQFYFQEFSFLVSLVALFFVAVLSKENEKELKKYKKQETDFKNRRKNFIEGTKIYFLQKIETLLYNIHRNQDLLNRIDVENILNNPQINLFLKAEDYQKIVVREGYFSCEDDCYKISIKIVEIIEKARQLLDKMKQSNFYLFGEVISFGEYRLEILQSFDELIEKTKS